MVWQEEPADSWEETLEVKDSWEMEEDTAKVKNKYKPRFSGSIVDPHWFQSESFSGFSFLPHCGSGSRE